jgi:hypothetical protein
MDYDYYNNLTDTAKKSSKAFEGPCYPVAMKSTSVYWSCQFTDGYAEGFNDMWTSNEVRGPALRTKRASTFGFESRTHVPQKLTGSISRMPIRLSILSVLFKPSLKALNPSRLMAGFV